MNAKTSLNKKQWCRYVEQNLLIDPRSSKVVAEVTSKAPKAASMGQMSASN